VNANGTVTSPRTSKAPSRSATVSWTDLRAECKELETLGALNLWPVQPRPPVRRSTSSRRDVHGDSDIRG
jgi:hypothetical protein